MTTNSVFTRFARQDLGLKRNWSLNTLRTICHRVDETGSVVTPRAGSGMLICRKSSRIKAIVSVRSRLRSYVAAARGHFAHSV